MRLDPLWRARSLYYSSKARAKREGIPFNLVRDDIVERVLFGHCEATGAKFDFRRSKKWHRQPLGPSLDRVNPKKGYTRNNVKVVTWQFNVAKNEYGLEDLLAMSLALVTRHGLISVTKEVAACGPKKMRKGTK